MSARLDRLLDRVWLALCAAGLIAATLCLGTAVGLGRRPDARPGLVVACASPAAAWNRDGPRP